MDINTSFNNSCKINQTANHKKNKKLVLDVHITKFTKHHFKHKNSS